MIAKPLTTLVARHRGPCLLLRRSFAAHDLHDYVSQLQLFAGRRNLPKARELHARLLATGLHASPFAVSALISLYSKCARPADALSVFLSAPSDSSNLFVWNATIAALASNGLPADALRLFRQLSSEPGLAPDEFTYPCAIGACSDLGASDEVRKIHAALLKAGFDAEMFTASALVHAYLKMGLSDEAERVFDELPHRDVVLWNALVNGFAQLGHFSRSLDYFHRMVGEGMVPSKFTVTGVLSVFTARADIRNGRKIHAFVIKMGFDNEIPVSNSLIDLYGKCHTLEEAEGIFESMKEKDVLSWNSMICACNFSAHHAKTLHLFCRMRCNAVMPDAVTIAAVLPACSQLAALRLGKVIHGLAIVSGMNFSKDDVFVSNALTDMYAKCGALEEARLLFNGMLVRDVASWNIIIDAYGSHGRGAEAVELFEQMVTSGLVPDEVTFVGVLSACSHAGLVGLGKELLQRMEAEFGVAPVMEHYACVVDMLGRVGLLEEAKGVAEKAGSSGAGVWRTYLAACRMHGEAAQASEAAERIMEMEPLGSGSYVLLANTLGGSGKFNDLAEVRGEMKRKGVRKAPGCSWVEVEGSRMHVFVAGDQDHPEAEEIYTTLHGLVGWMREEWEYMPEDTIGSMLVQDEKSPEEYFQNVQAESFRKQIPVKGLWNHPNQLFEEIVRCMKNIFISLADVSMAAYTVGGHSHSAACIEYGILKMKPPVRRPQTALLLALHKLKLSEEQKKFPVETFEPLVAFALSCGSYSSPAVKVYTPVNVKEELQEAQRDFIRASVGISSKGKLLVPLMTATLLLGSLNFLPKDKQTLFNSACHKDGSGFLAPEILEFYLSIPIFAIFSCLEKLT
ncbi:hypothetical protein Cni_G17278 [Canna indica]|uniref:DUF547 domain-containing protein n=1 Tax=Canna indica TaxID=4628 RepID=A0AAQ3KJ04_9LILI|nr:hypothetical protein Cni_G17278 [Canna indica]